MATIDNVMRQFFNQYPISTLRKDVETMSNEHHIEYKFDNETFKAILHKQRGYLNGLDVLTVKIWTDRRFLVSFDHIVLPTPMKNGDMIKSPEINMEHLPFIKQLCIEQDVTFWLTTYGPMMCPLFYFFDQHNLVFKIEFGTCVRHVYLLHTVK